MNVIYFLVIDLLIYVIGIKLIWQYCRNTRGFVVFMLILLLSCCVNLFLCQYRIRDFENRKNAETYERYAPIILNYVEEVRQRQHDFKNHLNAIYGLVQVTEEGRLRDEVREYIQSLNCALKEIDQTIYIDNGIISAIIYIKLCEAKNKNIQFSCSVNRKIDFFPLKEYEMSEMICNLIDNAFEAVENLSVSDRIVNLEIGKDDKCSFIMIKNNSEGFNSRDISKMFERGFSTKKKKGRGYGLYTVKRIVYNYDGSIVVSLEDDFIIFNISFKK
jgi:sensor histidine kinase regulating citrate/malate metabolism